MNPAAALWLARHRRLVGWLAVAGVLGTLLPLALVFVVVGGSVAQTQSSLGREDTAALSLGCVTPDGGSLPATLTLPGIPQSDQDEARKNAATIVSVVTAKNLPSRAAVVALAAAMQETHLLNLGVQEPSGSNGLFMQLRAYYPLGISSDPVAATEAFLGPAGSLPGLGPSIHGLLDVPDWQGMPVGTAAQTVQRSAFPSGYDKWEQTAVTWASALLGSTAGLCTTPSSGRVAWGSAFVDSATDAILRGVEAAVGPVVVTQGSWSNAAESGGTHSGAGAVDFVPSGGSWSAAVAVARSLGGIAWHRTPAEGFAEHIHMIVPEGGLSAAAAAQVADFGRGGDGLGGRDDGPAVAKVSFASSVVGPASGSGWTLPLAPGSYAVSSEYGMRTNPVTGIYKLHSGTDLAAPCGATELAAAAGVVVHAGPGQGWGNYVVVDHGGGVTTLYAHMATVLATEGESVAAGQQIGLEGSTGNSTGCHLHFETRVNDQPVPTRPFMEARGVTL